MRSNLSSRRMRLPPVLTMEDSREAPVLLTQEQFPVDICNVFCDSCLIIINGNIRKHTHTPFVHLRIYICLYIYM